MSPHPMIIAATAGMVLLLSPLAATAQPGHGHRDRGHAERSAPFHAGPGKHERKALLVNCPPGLAKKTPACLPPGQAKKLPALRVGQYLDLQHAHLISHPGRYGLSKAPTGNRYAIMDGRLMRVDESTGKILSILRVIDAILD